MSGVDGTSRDAGLSGIRSVPVWDPLVRIVHWTVALGIVVNGFFTDAESTLHEQIGYAVLALVILRLIWGMVGSRSARFSAFPPNPMAAMRHARTLLVRRRETHLSHNPLGALMAYNIWGTLLVIAATGYMMGTVRYFGVDWVEEVHEVAFNWLLMSVVLHVAGVLLESKLSGIPLVRAMLDGKKRVSNDQILR